MQMTDALHDIAGLRSAELRFGSLEVRLAASDEDLDAAQALRWRVFYEEMGAAPTPEMAARKRDFDRVDEHCDHLLVIDHTLTENPVIGTYRLTRRAMAAQCGGFYSSSEYDIARVLEYPGEVLELGRSCVAAEYRTGPVMMNLWRGVLAYVFKHNVRLIFGCASLPGTDPDAHAVPLSYLYYHHLAPPALRAKARPQYYVDMNLLPLEAFDPGAACDTARLDPRRGGNTLPPLIDGYIRLGGLVGEGAYIDPHFKTTDVFIVIKTDVMMMTSRYVRHYERGNKKDIALPVG
jgi:L-ornithine Nalpha-acyltransferase